MKSIYFKRLALVVVAALGMGLISTGPTSAAVSDESLTVSASTATAFVGDSATITATIAFTSSASGAEDSRSITSQVTNPATGGSVSVLFRPTSDSAAAVTSRGTPVEGTSTDLRNYAGVTSDTVTTTTNLGYVKQTFSVVMYNFSAAGTYYVTLRTQGAQTRATTGGSGSNEVFKTAMIIVTVTARDGVATGANAYIASDLYTAETNRTAFRAATDSAIVAVRGSVSSPAAVGYAAFTVKNAAGETVTASALGAANKSAGTALADTLTVTVSGPGLLTSGLTTTRAKAATVNAYNGATLRTQTTHSATGETLTIWSDGTAGVSTISVSGSSGVVFSTFTVTFTGDPASVSQLWLSDTIAQIGQTDSVIAIVKDSGGTVLKSGTVYLYSSDTSIAGATPTTYPNIGRTAHACSIGSTGLLNNCPVVLTDTGTVTLTLRDSWTVAASTWVSDALTLTVTGTDLHTLTATFDKATYTPGERAVLTLTAKDWAGTLIATGNLANEFNRVTPTPAGLTTVTGAANLGGTNAVGYDSPNLNTYRDTGVETRVVVMPTYGTDVTVEFRFGKLGSQTGENVSVTASAKVVDPNATAIAAAAAAAAKAGTDAVAAAAAAQAAATAAADAATDAALEAIDAANAATDAANLAAEAADAATVAAEEARDAADAATAAVEALATEVATLMAALKAQITTLANTVAKIAKKVKA